jgi:monothiol glutaredoxin
MKGTPAFPQCGFSARAAGMLKELGVEFGSFNILTDEEVRQGAKAYGDWPTFPQLYVDGELVGGSDIMLEMYENGQLKKLVDGA